MEEAQHSLGVESFSPTNLFFIGDVSYVIEYITDFPSLNLSHVEYPSF